MVNSIGYGDMILKNFEPKNIFAVDSVDRQLYLMNDDPSEEPEQFGFYFVVPNNAVEHAKENVKLIMEFVLLKLQRSLVDNPEIIIKPVKINKGAHIPKPSDYSETHSTVGIKFHGKVIDNIQALCQITT